jgi:hypothetical protein
MEVSIPAGAAADKALLEPVIIAVDSEFEGALTLTVQAAARLPDGVTLAVQVYRSTAVPALPPDFNLQAYLPLTPEKYGRFCENVILRPTKLLTPDLSPARMLIDLYGLAGWSVQPRGQVVDPFAVWGPANAVVNKRTGESEVPSIIIIFVGHFLRADFVRIFGRCFWESLRPTYHPARDEVAVEARKLISFRGLVGRRTVPDPVLESLRCGDNQFNVKVRTRDTMLPFGPASLGGHSQTFLGVGKSEALSDEEKRRMKETFQVRTADAFGYAIIDSVNTFLVYEQMLSKDREIALAFGLVK